jgi:hypothetical protein
MTDNLEPLRNIEGFPLGKDEDLHTLSNPPYYTAYPNPHITDFIKQNGKPYDDATDDYHREPFVGDLSADEQNPVFSAHNYHTKVPPEIIATLINHYSKPGDIVLDIFSGTGMTGVAARKNNRNCVLVDLSTISTFISFINSTAINWNLTVTQLTKIITETERELGYLYQTEDNLGRIGIINYTVWSDVFTCPYCNFEFPFFPHGVEHLHGKVKTKDSFNCPSCNAELNIRAVKRVISADGNKKKQAVWINAKSKNGTQDREPSKFDLDLVKNS